MLAVPVPVALPFKEMKDLIPFDNVMDKIHFVVAKATAGKPKAKETKTEREKKLFSIKFAAATQRLHQQRKSLLGSQLSVATPWTA